MKVDTVMKREVVAIAREATFREALARLTEQRVGTLPVLDWERRLVGVLSLREALKIILPDIVELMPDLDFAEDLGAVESTPLDDSLLERPVSELMEPAYSVEQGAGLIGTYTYMRQHQLTDVPVVDSSGRLVGLASWVDVGTGFLRDRLQAR
jgi:CBS-domain-containing membrane protein